MEARFHSKLIGGNRGESLDRYTQPHHKALAILQPRKSVGFGESYSGLESSPRPSSFAECLRMNI
jgi:hypothetical protein